MLATTHLNHRHFMVIRFVGVAACRLSPFAAAQTAHVGDRPMSISKPVLAHLADHRPWRPSQQPVLWQDDRLAEGA